MNERPTPEQIVEGFIAKEVGWHAPEMLVQAQELVCRHFWKSMLDAVVN